MNLLKVMQMMPKYTPTIRSLYYRYYKINCSAGSISELALLINNVVVTLQTKTVTLLSGSPISTWVFSNIKDGILEISNGTNIYYSTTPSSILIDLGKAEQANAILIAPQGNIGTAPVNTIQTLSIFGSNDSIGWIPLSNYTAISTTTGSWVVGSYRAFTIGIGTALLHFDGVAGSSSFTDVYGSLWYAIGATPPVIEINNTRFIGGAVNFPAGSTNAIVHNNTGIFTFTGDFTIEFQYYYTGTLIYACFCSIYTGTTEYLRIGLGSTIGNFLLYSNVDTSLVGNIGIAHGMAVNTWNAIMVERIGTSYYFGINGFRTLYATAASIVPLIPANIAIGNLPAHSLNYPASGVIDEFRMTNGVGLYAGNYAPELTPFMV